MTTITLDRRAMLALIDSDPDFALSLKGAVLSQIGVRFFEKDLRRIVAAAEPEMFAMALAALQRDEDGVALVRKALQSAVTQRTAPWGDRVTLTEDMKRLIAEEVTRVRDKVIRDAMSTVAADIVDRVHKHLEELNTDDRIERRVARLTEEHINAKVKELFAQRLAEISKP